MGLLLMFPPSLGRITARARVEQFGEWLADRIGNRVTVEIAGDYERLEWAIKTGHAELAWAPPAVCARVEPEVEAIYKAVRAGRTTYRAAILARPGVETLEGLRGKRAAWVDRWSAGGCLLALSALREHGLDPERDLDEQRFLGSYGMAMRAVIRGEADCTSVYVHEAREEAARAVIREQVGDLHESLAVVDYSGEAPTDGLVVSRGDDAARRVAWIDELTRLSDAEAAEAFAPLDAQAIERAQAWEYVKLRAALPT